MKPQDLGDNLAVQCDHYFEFRNNPGPRSLNRIQEATIIAPLFLNHYQFRDVHSLE